MTTVSEVLARANEYLQHGLDFTAEEIQLREELIDWLPDEIIDCHTHINNFEHVGDVPAKILTLQKSTYLYTDALMHRQIRMALMPGKKVSQFAFAFPYPGIDLRAANSSLLTLSADDPSFIPFATGLAPTVDQLLNDLEDNRFRGIKMYLSEINLSCELTSVFPLSVLELANQRGLPIIFHLPLPLRQTCDDLVELVSHFTNIPIILAHMGVEKLLSLELELAYDKSMCFDNIFFDTAMVTNTGVIAAVLKRFGSTRILFGTDQPLSLLRGQAVMHPELGLRFASDYDYHWADPEEQRFLRTKMTRTSHVFWGTIQGIKHVIEENCQDCNVAKQNIFYRNARQFFE